MALWVALMAVASSFQGGLLGVTATVHVDPSLTSANVHLSGWGIPTISGSATMDPDLRLEPSLDRFLRVRGVRLEDLEIQEGYIVLTVRLPLVGRRTIRLRQLTPP